MSEYDSFIARKAMVAPATGIDIDAAMRAFVAAFLFPFQLDLVLWALLRGRAAIFADTGLGKTRMQIAWARVIATTAGGRVLIFAPLSVAEQTVDEGARVGVPIVYARSMADAGDAPLVITNYEMREHFDPASFVGVVLDESSIIKDATSSTRTAMIDTFSATPYKLACTATPSPNDFTELGNHAEFLGIMRRTEMLAMYFTHDGGSTQDWTIKAHGKDAFWRWVCSWAALVKRPSDLGYDDVGYDLPPLVMTQHRVDATREQAAAQGLLFAIPASTLSEQRDARRASMQYMAAREGDDERHICPLQLGVIRRAVRLWTNPGDVVLSPFAGIGSEGYVAIQEGRRFVGAELKRSYYATAARNLADAEPRARRRTMDLFQATS